MEMGLFFSSSFFFFFFFGHNKWIAKRQGRRNLEFHIVHLLEPAPQTQTATAHLLIAWTVYFDGQGTQKLPCGKVPPPPPPPPPMS